MRFTDTICACNHWFEEHDADGCGAPDCQCEAFAFSPRNNTPEAIADRGADGHFDECECAMCATTNFFLS